MKPVSELADLDSPLGCLGDLTAQQRAQIIRQIDYHLTAPPYEDVHINDILSLRLGISPGVTRPMSSKLLAKWLWKSPQLYFRQRVLDIGTGCGIQGLTCLLGGAAYAVLADLSEDAAKCAEGNLERLGLSSRGAVQVSDLFGATKGTFDLIIFAQPYFLGRPIPKYAFTQGMLADRNLLQRFFASARPMLRAGGHLVLMGWTFAGEENDPRLVGRQFGFEEIEVSLHRDLQSVQQGEFHVVLLR